MQQFDRTSRGAQLMRHFVAPAMACAAIALSTTSAFALTHRQNKPQLTVEAERSAQGARLTFKGKGWAANARLKVTGTRAPGASGTQDFGMFSADSSGNLTARKIATCSTSNTEDGSREPVTITATDSATGSKAMTKVQGGAWVCQ